MDFKELVAAFGERCGLGNLTMDENGVATMQADDIVLSFAEVSATRQLLMQAEVRQTPLDGADALHNALADNFGIPCGQGIGKQFGKERRA